MGIFDWLGIRRDPKAETSESGRAPRLSPAQVAEIVEYFPVGSRLSYYPEFRKATRLDTLILGFGFDQRLVFSSREIQIEADGCGPEIAICGEAGRECLPGVDSLQILIPFSHRSEVDYPKASSGEQARFTEKVVNDFQRGNTITLFNKGANGKVPHLDTTVARVVVLEGGYFANRKAVMLEPDVESFQLLDQRLYHRVYAQIPASLSVAPEADEELCVIEDFSEKFVRVGLGMGLPQRERFREGERLFLRVKVGPGANSLVHRTVVHRVGEDHLVLSLAAVLKDKRFQPMSLIDEFEFKSALLLCSQALEGGDEASSLPSPPVPEARKH